MYPLKCTEVMERMISNCILPTIIPTPDADNKFIERYNNIARANGFMADLYRPWNAAGARFHDVLSVEIDKDRDIWAGLDYKVVKEMGKDRLLYVESKTGSDEHIYLGPPEAGHDSGIIHYGNDLSKSIALNALQHGNIWIMDKRGAKKEHASFGLDDCIKRSVDAIEYIARETGKKVNVAGFCQGGWEGFIASYLTRDNVKSVASGGTPYHWRSNDLSDLTRNINPANAKDAKKIEKQRVLIKDLIERNEGVMPGTWNLLGFIGFSKDQLMDKDIRNLWKDAVDNNVEGLERFARFRPGWFMAPQSMGGNFFLDVYDKFYSKDQLFEGGLEIMGERIDLDKFDLPMYCLNGKKDNITSRGQQMDLFERISTDLSYMVEDSLDAGHLGLFNSSGAMPLWNSWFRTVTHKDFGKKSFSARKCYADFARAA